MPVIPRIAASLKANGFDSFTFKAGDGALLTTPFAARILACEIAGVPGNLFWHNPGLENKASAGEAMRGGISGGDRLWIAPEIGFQWRDLKLARRKPFPGYRVQPAMDPGSWRIAGRGADVLCLAMRAKMTEHRLGRTITLDAERRFTVIDPPHGLPASLRCVSFAIRNDLTLVKAGPGTVAGAWDLLQLPVTGLLVCPTTRRVAPRSYYSPFGPRHVKTDAGKVTFLIDARRQVKMGIRPEDTTGRMGYYRRLPGGKISTLVVRIFAPQPGEPYVDMPRSSDTFIGGDAVQAYNNGGVLGGLGAFGEMEYHDAGLTADGPTRSRGGVSVTHALAGPDRAIRAAGAALLGVALPV